jgi:methionyl-tRNA formyltransferase
MRLFCLVNNWLGWQVVQWLRKQGEEIVGLVVHPPGRTRYEEEIRSVVAGTECLVSDGSRLCEPEILDQARKLRAEMAVSVLFGYLLRKEFLQLFPRRCINLHPALLPYNRGAYPNVWSIVEGTPAGVTLHYIDEGVDTGDIISQKEVTVEATDTGASLYRKLELAGLELFQQTWPSLRQGVAPSWPQNTKEVTSHRARDVERIDEIDLGKMYRAGDLVDLLRARTFPPHPGAYFRSKGRKVFLRLELFEEPDKSGKGGK